MKKIVLFITVSVIMLMAFTTTSFAQLPLRVVVNGNRVNFPDAEPFIDDNGRTQVPVRFVSEVLGARVDWDPAVRTVYIDTREKGDSKDDTPKDGSIIEKNGYLVPNDTNIIIANAQESRIVETRMSINIMKPNFEKQVEDLTFALENKFGKDIANQVRKHVEQKKSRWDYLPEKYIYIEKTNQYIWIRESQTDSISINVMVPGYVPDTSQYDDVVVEWEN